MSKSYRVCSTVLGGVLASALTLTWAVSSAEAQATDGRWLPWLGCWEATDMGAEESDGTMLCVIPATTHSGVELTTVLPDGRVSSPEPLLGDGVERSFSGEGCEGTHAAEFSDDGTRVYVHTEQVCEGDVHRTTRGVFAMVTPYEWVDVQAVDTEGRGAAWAMRYRAVSDGRTEAAGQGAVLEGRRLSVRSARIGAARPPGADDVAEVYRHVGAEAAKAWVVEMSSPVELDAERLIELADAGVPGDVIDVVVAVSYPTRFSVDRETGVTELEPEPTGYAARAPYYGYGFFGFNRWDPFYSSLYSPYGYGYGYGYGSGYGGYYGYYQPTVIRVEPRNDGQMRVVNGRGWTRSQTSTGTTGSGATSRTPARRSTGTSAGAAAGSSGRSTAGAPSSGGSSRSGGSSTGRTARPR
jgi:hypothetical protein